MKTLVVISDTHGNKKGVEQLKPLFLENDYAVYLGDGFSDFKEIFSEQPEKCYFCKGNCDFFAPLPEEGILEVEKLRIFYCHGHRYGVKGTLVALAKRAKELDCSVALYGHSHRPSIEELGGVTLINPGSLRFPATQGGSYAYLVVHGEKLTATIVGENPN
ncbi:MAG: metallophosphoesterase [Clostridia bacterium]|nr:metallophosphoesterase [Clostridia bacterium]